MRSSMVSESLIRCVPVPGSGARWREVGMEGYRRRASFLRERDQPHLQ